MKIKTLILSTVAAAGLSTGAMAADLGTVITSLDICDAQGASGLTISGTNNCLVISGSVSYSLTYGELGTDTGDAVADATLDWQSVVETSLTFAATSDTDVGAATASMTLGSTETRSESGLSDTGSNVTVTSAFVNIGGSGAFLQVGSGTVPADVAGHESGDHLWTAAGPTTGDHYIFTSFDLGNSVAASLSLEGAVGPAASAVDGTVVGTLAYDAAGFSAFVTGAAGGLFAATAITWAAEAGVAYSDDMYSAALAGFYDSSTAWGAAASLGWAYDIWTLGLDAGVSADAAAVLSYNVDGSASVAVSDTVVFSAGAGYHVVGAVSTVVADAGVAVALTDTLAAGLVADVAYNLTAATVAYGVGAELVWTPGSGVEGTVGAEYASSGNWNVSTSLSKAFD